MVKSIFWIAFVLCSATVFAANDGPAEGAPKELSHWSGLIGQWSTEEESLKPDGSGWVASNGADWSFFWSLDGWGVRDDYFSPPLEQALDDESLRQRGTNLRVFDVSAKQWVMTWLTTTSSTPKTFTAQSDSKKIVMHADKLSPQGFYHRITFFDIEANSFEWKLEWSRDEHNWTEVYRIHGKRKR